MSYPRLKKISCAIAISATSAAWADYVIFDMGTFGGNSSDVSALNNSGIALGGATNASGDTLPFLFDGTLHNIYQTIGSDVFLGGNDINDSGQMAGLMRATSAPISTYRAVILDSGVVTELGSIGGDRSNPYAINANGDVVGFSYLSDNVTPHAFLYTGGTMADLGTLPGNAYSIAFGINGNADVVGISGGGTAVDRPFLYRNGVMYDLGSFGGWTGTARSINDSGQIVGWSSVTGNTANRAFVYDNGVMTDLGSLSGRPSCIAWGINNNGSIVGNCTVTYGGADAHAFLYSNGVMQDLNDLLPANSGWTLLIARKVNDSEQIVGLGVINGERHAFMMSPGC